MPVILDAKRGDIGSTAAQYAIEAFERYGADAVTLSPYMGRDSIEPFLHRPGKWAIVLGITSNAGANDFQFIADANGQRLFEAVIAKCAQWGSPDELMFVTGATRPELLIQARALAPDHFFLVPGVGAAQRRRERLRAVEERRHQRRHAALQGHLPRSSQR